jgi:hypothetical protein
MEQKKFIDYFSKWHTLRVSVLKESGLSQVASWLFTEELLSSLQKTLIWVIFLSSILLHRLYNGNFLQILITIIITLVSNANQLYFAEPRYDFIFLC